MRFLDRLVTVRLAARDVERLEAHAQARGLNLSTWMRTVALEQLLSEESAGGTV